MDFKALFSNFKSEAGSSWDDMSDEEKELAAEVFADYGNLVLRAQAGEDVSEEREQVDSQLAGLSAIAADKFKEIAFRVFRTAMTTALKIAILAI